MPKKTIAQKLIDGLKASDFEELPCKSGKYRAFGKGNLTHKFFVGRAGALRVGEVPTKSRSLTGGKIYETLLLKGGGR